MNRFAKAWLVGLVFLAFGPLLPAFWIDEAPGAGPDVVSTLWGMWWFQQSWMGAAWSGWTDLVNHPYGAWGTVLSPSSAILWGITEPLLGPARSGVLVGGLQIGGLALGTVWLATVVGISRTGAFVAGLSLLIGRYLFFGLGEGSVVAIAALPLPLGLAALLRLRQESETEPHRWLALAAACMGWMALENPYLAPVLPGVALVLVLGDLQRWRGDGEAQAASRVSIRRSGVALLLGVSSILLVAWMFSRSASPDYPREVAGETATLLGMGFDIVDLTHARALPTEWFLPGEVRWTRDAEEAALATGGRYLGLSVMLLAAFGTVATWRRSWPWTLLAGTCLALSLGSVVYGVGGVFLYLNALMSWVARPLTQPTRFLVVAIVALAILVGLGVDAACRKVADRRRPWVIGAVLLAMLVDFSWVGGGALRLPTTAVPRATCLADLDAEDGAVMVWPWDAQDGELGRSQLLQIAHERPAAHTGIASWQLHQTQVTTELRNGGLNTLGDRNNRFNINHFQDRGFRYLIIEDGEIPEAQEWLEDQLDPPVVSCDGWKVYDIGLPEDRPPPEADSAEAEPLGDGLR